MSTFSISSIPGTAKKRDVRTISSSPSDLGPPSKTSNGTNQTQKSSARTLPNSRKFYETKKNKNFSNLQIHRL